MNGLLTAVAVLGSLAVFWLIVAVGTGWRPGGRRAPSLDLVRERTRRELGLAPADWKAVVHAVALGEAAPERLRPAAYELAGRLDEAQRRTLFVRRPGVTVAVAVAVGLLMGGVYWLATDDLPSWARPVALVPGLLFALGIPYNAQRERSRLEAAVEANRPA